MNDGTCKIDRVTYTNSIYYRKIREIWWTTAGNKWRYDKITYDVSGLKAIGSDGYLLGSGLISVPIGNGDARGDRIVPWRGCIEERQTVTTTIDVGTGVPAAAYDLDIDLVPDPSRPETLWGPSLPHLVFTHRVDPLDLYNKANIFPFDDTGAMVNTGDGRAIVTPGTNATDSVLDANGNGMIDPGEGDGSMGSCPSPARRIAPIDTSTLQSYLANLKLAHGTYHDIGLLWGARMLSGDGPYASENRASSNGGPIIRHLILMTDGYTEPDIGIDSAYGLEPYDHRRQSATPIQQSRNNQGGKNALAATINGRFQAICKAARGKFTVWVIAFGLTLDDNLRNCATPGSAFQANNADELNQRFQDIAGRIANLRITR